MKYLSKDQNLADEQTIYWFEVEANDVIINVEEGQVFGIADCNGERSPLDCDGCPVEGNDYLVNKVMDLCVITDEMECE